MKLNEVKKPVSEATLSQRRTSGERAWESMVKNNQNWQELELEIEKGQNDVPVLNKDGEQIGTLNAGDQIQLTSNEEVAIRGKEFAQTKRGLVPISKIRKPTKTDSLKAERIALDALDKSIKEVGEPINMIMVDSAGKKVGPYKQIVGVQDVPGTPKADFALIDADGNEVGWISHKKKGGAKAFQQYSGTSKKTGMDHPEIDAFHKAINKTIQHEGAERLPYPVWRPIKSDKLKNMAIFGPDFGSAYGRENVDIIGQGDPVLEPQEEGGYLLKWSDHSAINGNLKPFQQEDAFEPVLGATYRQNRVAGYGDHKVQNVRSGIYPYGMLSYRTNLKQI